MIERFPEDMLSPDDLKLAAQIVPNSFVTPTSYYHELRDPDVVIAPDGRPYLYRWHLVRQPEANSYFHIQVADDPERPLHDHPWDNQSVILAGGYEETLDTAPAEGLAPSYEDDDYQHVVEEFVRKPGDVIWRKAEWAHTLRLPAGSPYTMTLFSTGPKVRDWGFWYPEGWKLWTDVTKFVGNKSIHIHNEAMS